MIGGGRWLPLLLLVGLAALPPLALRLADLDAQDQAGAPAAETAMVELAGRAAREVEARIAQARALLAVAAQHPAWRDPRPGSCDAAVGPMAAAAPLLASLAVIDARGRVLCTSLPAMRGADLGGRPDLRRAVETRAFVASDLLRAAGADQPASLAALMPVAGDGGEPRQLLLGAIRLDRLGSAGTTPERPPSDAALGLLDAGGQLHALGAVAGQAPGPARLPALVPVSTEAASGSWRATDVGGAPGLHAFAAVPGTALRVVAGREEDPAPEPARATHRQMLLVTLGVGLASILAALLAGDVLLLRPHRRLAAAVRRVAAGESSAETMRQIGRLGPAGRDLATLGTRLAAQDEALRASEARFRAVFASAFRYTALLSPDGIVLESNRAFFSSPETGQPALAASVALWDAAPWSPRSREEIRDAIGQAASGAPVRLEALARTEAGQESVLELSFCPLPDAQERIALIVSEAQDVTESRTLEAERRAREEDLRQANARLDRLARHLARARDSAEEASRAKSRFLASMSHELRTPLNGILGYAQLLKFGELDPTRAQQVEAMLGAGAHLLDMINRVLDFSRIEAKQLELLPAETELLPLLQGCRELLQPGMDAKGLAFQLVAAPEAPRCLYVDPARLRQVLLNLLGNAVKFTRAGKVELRLLACPAGLRIEVADTGPGVPARLRPILFRGFERLSADAEAIEGAGLGLAISARLVTLMGGRIGHADNPGGGSVFWFELPVGEPVGEPGQGAAPAGRAVTGPARPLRILVVDDMAMNRDIARGFLMAAGHEVVLAESGAEAVERAGTDSFDAILMDVRMPGMDGLEATRRIRALPGRQGQVPVLAMTANALADQVQACLQAGMDAHVAKPVVQGELLAALARVVAATETPPAAAEPVPAEPPVLDRAMFEQTASFLAPEQVAAHVRTLTGRIEALRQRLSGGGRLDEPDLVTAAHMLAGGAGSFGLRRLAAAARRFEQGAEAGSAELPGLTRALMDAAEASLAALATTPPVLPA